MDKNHVRVVKYYVNVVFSINQWWKGKWQGKWSRRENICSGLTEVKKRISAIVVKELVMVSFLCKTSHRYVYWAQKWNSHSCWHEQKIHTGWKQNERPRKIYTQLCSASKRILVISYTWLFSDLNFVQLIHQKHDHPTALIVYSTAHKRYIKITT